MNAVALVLVLGLTRSSSSAASSPAVSTTASSAAPSSSSLAADPVVQDGIARYRALDLEQALLRFQDAALKDGRPAPERAVVLCWIGATYGQMGDLDAARRSFARAAEADVDVVLPVDVAPKVRRAFDEVVAAARAARPPVVLAPPTVDASPPPVIVDAPPVVDVPPPAAPVETVEPVDSGPGTAVAWTVGGVGVVAVVGAAVCGTIAALQYATAADPGTTQVDALAARDVAIGAGIVGAALAVVGAGAIVGGVLLAPGEDAAAP